MSTNVSKRWLLTENGVNVAPKTVTSAVLNADGTTLESRLAAIERYLDEAVFLTNFSTAKAASSEPVETVDVSESANI